MLGGNQNTHSSRSGSSSELEREPHAFGCIFACNLQLGRRSEGGPGEVRAGPAAELTFSALISPVPPKCPPVGFLVA